MSVKKRTHVLPGDEPKGKDLKYSIIDLDLSIGGIGVPGKVRFEIIYDDVKLGEQEIDFYDLRIPAIHKRIKEQIREGADRWRLLAKLKGKLYNV